MPHPTAPAGFSPKHIFFDIIEPHFQRNAKRVATAFLGSACEQWVNGEAFQALVDEPDNGRRLWVRPEKEKRDLVLYRRPKDEDDGVPALVIESKVLYASEALKKQEQRLYTLAGQLRHAMDKYPKVPCVGLLMSFDWCWWEGDARKRTPAYKRAGEPFLGHADYPNLENAFGQGGRRGLGRRSKKGGRAAPELVNLGPFTYEVRMSVELVRVRLR